MPRGKFYGTWNRMFSRCYNTNNPKYKIYGARGIKVLWKDFESFRDDMYQSFLEHIEKYGAKNTSIDRYPDNDGHYCKKNCRWATALQQRQNQRPQFFHFIIYKGKKKYLTEWAREYRLQEFTLRARLKLGWSIKRALTESSFLGKNQTYLTKNNKSANI